MKFGSFLLGGLVGAAAVIYLNNKNKSMLLSAFSSNNRSLGGSDDKARSKEAQWFPEDKNEEQAAGAFKTDEKHAYSSSSTLGKVQEIVAGDQELKSTVNEILAENGQTKVYQTK